MLGLHYIRSTQIRKACRMRTPFISAGRARSEYYLSLSRANDLEIRELRLFENLESLSVSQSGLRDIQFITDIKELSRLSLDFNHIEDIRPVLSFPHLSRLNLSHNEIVNPPDLSPLRCLKELDISFNQLSDLNFLNGFGVLERLDIEHNHISDLSILANMKNLTELDARGNPVKSVEPLLSLPRLKSVLLSIPLCEDASIIYINTRKIFAHGELSIVKNEYYDRRRLWGGYSGLPDAYRDMIYTLLNFRRYDTVIKKTDDVYKANCSYDFTENQRAYEQLKGLPDSRFKNETVAWLKSRPPLKLPEYVEESYKMTPGRSGSFTFYPIEGGGFLGGNEPYTVGRYKYKEVQPYHDWSG